ncbi:MAG: pyridoxal kinase PdxY [Beijerinckiaceae bacterium]
MTILSIQSHVTYGHVGNASAVFPMQRLGVEVWPIHTVQFSNHTGYGAWKGRVFDAALIDEIVEGIAERGALERCSGVISGYMGSDDIGDAILRTVARVRRANPSAMYCCDPVIGDVGRGIFVRPGIPELMRDRAVPGADIITPNQFELNYLSGIETRLLSDVRRAVQQLQQAGPKIVLVTSLITDETPADSLDMLAADHEGVYRLRTPRLTLNVNGAGDAVAALFMVHCLRTGSAYDALARAGAAIYGLLKRTADAGSRELLTIEAQDEFVAPSRLFPVETL